MEKDIILTCEGLNKIFGHGKKACHAVVDANITVGRGEVISIVGESGSGKTTLAKMLLGLTPISSGRILYNGAERNLKGQAAKKQYWTEVQAIFQDPFSSFNQFYTVETLLINCLQFKGIPTKGPEAIKVMENACSYVNLPFEELRSKHPFELSGGQMQRLMIARIFILHPKVLIADEPTSMIDACSRSSILEMLMKLRDDNGMTIIFITHDMGLAYYVSDQIIIMEKGVILERGTSEEVIANPTSPYTKQLLKDVPTLHSKWELYED